VGSTASGHVVVQRKIILVYITLIVLFNGLLKKPPRKDAIGTFVAAILGGISYVILRKTIFFTSKHSEILSPMILWFVALELKPLLLRRS
jgi:hypothetical protein